MTFVFVLLTSSCCGPFEFRPENEFSPVPTRGAHDEVKPVLRVKLRVTVDGTRVSVVHHYDTAARAAPPQLRHRVCAPLFIVARHQSYRCRVPSLGGSCRVWGGEGRGGEGRGGEGRGGTLLLVPYAIAVTHHWPRVPEGGGALFGRG